MVGLQAMILGRLGKTESSPSKSVCSILPIAICGPGLYGALALYNACIVGRVVLPPWLHNAAFALRPPLRCAGHRVVRL